MRNARTRSRNRRAEAARRAEVAAIYSEMDAAIAAAKDAIWRQAAGRLARSSARVGILSFNARFDEAWHGSSARG